VKIIKYPIKEVDIKTIPENRMLGIGISGTQKELCKKNIKQYGLVMPIVTVEEPSGAMMVLKGNNELSVLKEMKVDKADVFVTRIQSPDDIGKAIILLSSLRRELNHISEGLILKEILNLGHYNQKELAEQLMKSEAWISKRLSLVERLNDNVAAMVTDKALCPSIAQNIARIPKDRQHTFAMNICANRIPKSMVERLVGAYTDKNTPDALKEEIINNPLCAMENISTASIKRNRGKVDDNVKFQNALKLILNVIHDIEVFFAVWEKEKIFKYASLIQAVEDSVKKFLTLLKHWEVSPGKPDSYEGSDIND